MDFFNPARLEEHVRKTMGFYHPRVIDTQGGFFQYLKDDGEVYNASHRHLVSSTRYVFTYARYAMHFDAPEYLRWAQHGLDYLEQTHFQSAYQGYAWTIESGQAEDTTNHCYGLAFVILAYATALKAGITAAREGLYRAHALQSRHFWLPEHNLYADEADASWSVGEYRGQNANMHSCEAMLCAYEATGDRQFLDRALAVARTMCQRLAPLGGGLIWEHYNTDWQVDWDYNKEDPKHLFRPWGFQVGHQTEWAKLLVLLERHAPEESWLLPWAEHFFLTSVPAGWDEVRGGLVYGLAPDMTVCDGDKYFWVQAETLAAAALLGERTGDQRYWRWYQKIWEFSWDHMIDHAHGGWYRILSPENAAYSDEKSPAGKVDYHTMGACYDMIGVLNRLKG
ncbi:AGE family epimerase/isomerase [Pokkaliibacter sp. CJK22405]|uniref:AGE family epimerase/isomerase n=1 Tax=Pokkaliibacter sp. CJK22405 TaxID=3384615 RepID=UPI0039855BD1